MMIVTDSGDCDDDNDNGFVHLESHSARCCCERLTRVSVSSRIQDLSVNELAPAFLLV